MSKNKRDKIPPADEVQNSEGADAEPGGASAGESEGSGWGKGELAALVEQNAELKDRFLRLAAEMENLRRRTERDKADTAKYAISSFARDVLTIGDNIARAIEHVPEAAAEADSALKSFLEGMQVTERELLNVMERHGIARVDPKGERFDPNKHQAMFEVDDKGVAEGTIVEVVQAGYVIAERVLRPALVGIAKGGAKSVRAQTAPAQAEPPQAANDDAAPPQSAPESPRAARDAKTASEGKPARTGPAAKDGKAKKAGGRGKKGVGGKVDKSA